jgi:hypothetical protein
MWQHESTVIANINAQMKNTEVNDHYSSTDFYENRKQIIVLCCSGIEISGIFKILDMSCHVCRTHN